MSAARTIRDLEKRISKLEAAPAKLPTRMASSAGGGGGGGPAEGTYVPLVRADSPEELSTEVEPYTMGYIEAGEYEGAWFTRMNDEWVGLNVWIAEEEEE